MKLPLLHARTPETTLCSYCPKLCRPACPVSTIEGRETVTPWGKMRSAGSVERGILPATQEHLAPAWACTGCMGCRELCELDNPVADTLRDARADAFVAGLAPVSVQRFVEKHADREVKLGARGKHVSEGISNEQSSVVFLPGCTSVATEPASTRATAKFVSQIAGEQGVRVVAEQCCGLPLLEAGDREGFRKNAVAMVSQLSGATAVVVSDPGCAHTLRLQYQREGLAVPAVLHVSEWLATKQSALLRREDLPERVAYHDACRLGRGLGVYDPPRKILTELLGHPPLELPYHHAQGACSGGGGLLPETSAETSRAISNELATLAREVRAELVVSTCVTTVRKLRKAGIAAIELGALLAGERV